MPQNAGASIAMETTTWPTHTGLPALASLKQGSSPVIHGKLTVLTPSKWLGIDLDDSEPNFLNLGVVIDDTMPTHQLLVSLTVGYVVMTSHVFSCLKELQQEREIRSFCKRVVKRANEKAATGCERMLIIFDSAWRIRTCLCVRPHGL